MDLLDLGGVGGVAVGADVALEGLPHAAEEVPQVGAELQEVEPLVHPDRVEVRPIGPSRGNPLVGATEGGGW